MKKKPYPKIQKLINNALKVCISFIVPLMMVEQFIIIIITKKLKLTLTLKRKWGLIISPFFNIMNDSEARQLTKETSLIKAGRAIRAMGAQYVAIKKGEHGALLFGENEFFSCGAYPLEDIHDPTGAVDTFAGGIAGYLAGAVKNVTLTDLRKAMIYGSVLASFTVEAFSLERLRRLAMKDVDARYEAFKSMSQFEFSE